MPNLDFLVLLSPIMAQILHSCILRLFLVATAEDRILFLPCGIRSVKGPLFLLDEFHSWRSREQLPVLLFIAGPAVSHSLSCY